MTSPRVLRPSADVAERVLLPGDPGRALRLAQLLTEAPKMLNHHRGLWGYTGEAPDGRPLTVQSTGLGGPSAAAVVKELVELGARRLVRVGTCRALPGGPEPGAILVVEGALPEDGASRALGAEPPVRPDPGLLAALRETGAGQAALVVSNDLLHDPGAEREAGWAATGAVAADLTTAAVLTAAARRGAAAAALLGVTQRAGERLGAGAWEELERELGRAAAAALV